MGENIIFSLRSWEQLGEIVYQRFTPENAVIVPPEAKRESSEEDWFKRHRRPVGRPEDEMILEENPDAQEGDEKYILRPDPDRKNRPQYPTRKRNRQCSEKDHCWEYLQFWRCGDHHSREELDLMNTYRTELCPYYVAGCPHGPQCNFAHGLKELRCYVCKRNGDHPSSLCPRKQPAPVVIELVDDQ